MVLADWIEDKRSGETAIINQIAVRQMLESLGEKERILMTLRYLEGKTQIECAKLLDINQVAVSRLEKKILMQLKKQI